MFGYNCVVSLSFFNIVFGLLLAAIFYRIYFDRELKNHKYLFWYGTWFAVGTLQIFTFEYLRAHGLILIFPYGIAYFFLSLIQSFILYLAATSFGEKKLRNHIIGFLIFSFILHIVGLYINSIVLLGIASLAEVAIMLFNLISLSKARYRVLRIPLILSWLGWMVLEYKIFMPGDAYIFVALTNINVALTSLTVLGLHLHKILLERDHYKIKAHKLKETLRKIDKLEVNLIQLVSMLSE